MKISFLVTYYQQKKYISQSMEALLALEKPAEWEILIGDDGSTDGSTELAQSYADQDPEHIRLFVMPRDPTRKYLAIERASENRLNLVRHATGDCYCLMDGDDFYSETDFILQALEILENHPEVTVVGFDTWMYREGGPERLPRKGNSRPHFLHREKYLRWQYTHAGACVIRNIHTQENLACLERLNYFDDNEITLNALNFGKMVRIYRPVYAYRQDASSMYVAMSPSERAALNVAAMGVALRIMGPEWEKVLYARFATGILMAWNLRSHLKENIRPDKYEAYLRICHRAGFETGVKLLQYPELEQSEWGEVRTLVCRAGRESPPRVLYAWMQTWRREKCHE